MRDSPPLPSENQALDGMSPSAERASGVSVTTSLGGPPWWLWSVRVKVRLRVRVRVWVRVRVRVWVRLQAKG